VKLFVSQLHLLRDWAGCSTITGHGLTKGAFGYPQILPRSLFDLGENRAVELTDGTPYDLKITVVYDASEGGQPARLAAEEVVTEIRGIFHTVYGTPDSATEIALEACEAVADTFFPLSDLRKVDQWRAEYISLRQDPPEAFLAVGELPA